MTSLRARHDQRQTWPIRLRNLSVLIGGGMLLGCSALLEREHDQCSTSEDCQHFGMGSVCTTNGTCRRATAPIGAPPDSSLPVCKRDADCGDSSVCRDAVCRDLERSGCVMLSASGFDSRAERLPLLLLLPDTLRDANRFRSVVGTAARAWSAARQVETELPELSIVACPASDPRSLDLLDRAGIRLVLAAVKTAQLESVLEAVDGRALVFAPFADAPGLRDLIESRRTTSVVSCKPNRADGVAGISSAIAAVSSAFEQEGRIAPGARAIVALNENEVRYGYDAILEGTTFDSVPYSADSIGPALTSETDTPGLIVGISGEVDWSLNITAIESSNLGNADPPPAYLLMDRQASVRELVVQNEFASNSVFTAADNPTPLKDRLVIWDHAVADRNREIHDRFAALLPPGEALGPDLDYVHDCLYVALYASLAARMRFAFSWSGLSVEAVLVGLNALVGGEPLPIGSTHLIEGRARLEAALGYDYALDLFGASGDLDFVGVPTIEEAVLSPASRLVAPSRGAEEFYCVDVKQDHCPTGVTVSEPGILTGESECPCFTVK